MEDVIEPRGRRKSAAKLGLVQQSEAAECGLACLVMVLNFHGNGITLPELRLQDPVSLNGVTLLGLMRDAVHLGTTPRALRLELDELPALDVPCILHWDLQHFVVLQSATRDKVVIHDPARGVLGMSLAEAGKHFTGIALEIRPNLEFARSRRNRRRITLASVAGRITGMKRAFLEILALSVAIEGFGIAAPLYMQWVLDQVLVANDHGLLVLVGVGFAFLAIFRTVTAAMRSWSITWIGANLNAQWEANLFRHLVSLPAAFFEKRHVGDVVSRFTSVKAIQGVLTSQFVATILEGAMSVLMVGLMFLYNARLTALVVLAFLVYLVLRWRFYAPLQSANEEKIQQAALQQSNLLEAMRGIRSLQLCNQQAARTSDYGNRLAATINRDVSVQRLQIWFELGNGLIFGLCRVAVVWYAATLVMDGALTAGMLVSFIAYADMFSTRAAKFVNQAYEIRLLGIHAERISEISLAKPEPHLHAQSPAHPADASLEVRNLSFRYGRDEPWILDGVDMRIEDGECVAIVGPSGSGKSTLAKLMLGLLEASQGEIAFGGAELRKIGKVPYRDMVAAVLQDDTLFAGSIAANIAFFDPSFRLEDVAEAARMAQIHDDILAMPMGYNTLIGDMGSTLSGGQQQRVILARALYRKPRLLILDEATSHLDVACERRVNAVVSQLHLTRIIIAHRADTIASASRVIDLGALRRPVSHRAAPVADPPAVDSVLA